MQQNIEFERCIDFLVRMLDKYHTISSKIFNNSRFTFSIKIYLTLYNYSTKATPV